MFRLRYAPAFGKGVLSMSRSENRQVRSQTRSAEYWRRRRNDNIILALATFLVFVVPVFYYGAIEYGWIHRPMLPEFKNSLWYVGAIGFLYFLQQVSKYIDYRQDDENDRKTHAS